MVLAGNTIEKSRNLEMFAGTGMASWMRSVAGRLRAKPLLGRELLPSDNVGREHYYCIGG
jgi:hypothetical protein